MDKWRGEDIFSRLLEATLSNARKKFKERSPMAIVYFVIFALLIAASITIALLDANYSLHQMQGWWQ